MGRSMVPRMPSHLRAILGITVVGALLRFGTLDLQSFWADEAVTVELIRMPLAPMLDAIPDSESAPPFYYMLAWLWSRVFGSGEVGLRSLSALAGTAAIPVFYAAAAELCGRRLALAVAALAAVSPFLVWYSQEARAYALLSLLGAVSVWSFACMLSRPHWRPAAIWALASSLAVATHYFAIFLIATEVLWLLVAKGTRRYALPGVAAVLIASLAVLPIALHQRSLRLAAWILDTPLPERGARTVKQLLIGYDAPLETLLMAAAVVIAAAGVLLALRSARREGFRGLWVTFALAASAIVMPFAFALGGIDHFDARNVMAGWLPFAMIVSAGLTSSWAGRAGVTALLALCAVMATATVGVVAEPAWQRSDWRGASAALGKPEARVIVLGSTRPEVLRAYRDRIGYLTEARVREIAVMFTIPRSQDRFGIGKPFRAHLEVPGFRVVERRFTKTYSLSRLRAQAPRRLTAADLLRDAVLPGQSKTFLVERP